MSGTIPNCSTADDKTLNYDICEFIVRDFDIFVYVSFPLLSVLLLLLLVMTICLICCCYKQWKRKKRMYVIEEQKDGGKNVIVLLILRHGIITDIKLSNRE